MNTNAVTLIDIPQYPPALTTERSLDALYAVAHMFLGEDRIEDAVRAFRVLMRIAPTDERGWLGVGACHERRDEHAIASEIYGAGSVVTSPLSWRCVIALARLARRRGDTFAADDLLDEAEAIADANDDEDAHAVVETERSAR